MNVARSPSSGTLSARIRKQRGSFTLDVQVEAPPGITILFGPSGSGKTTLLDCLAGLLTPDAGHITLESRVLFDSASHVNVPVPRRNAGYVFQRLELFPHLTVAANVEYGLAHLPRSVRYERSTAICEAFGIPHLLQRKPSAISGGERQRVALARALVTEPCMLLLDEPLRGLDLPIWSRLLEDLRRWNEAHRTPIVYVTHDRNEVFALGEQVVVLEQGRVLAEGSPYDVLQTPQHQFTAELTGVENLFEATVSALQEAEGTMLCMLPNCGEAGHPGGGVELQIPLTAAAPGDRLRVAIRAGDILLAVSEPRGLSTRNVLAGRVSSMTRRDRTMVVKVNCGACFEVHVTPAPKDLELQPGRAVWLIIKTDSCHLLRRGAAGNHQPE